VKTLALIAIAAAPLAACSEGNDRMHTGSPELDGGAVYLDSFQPTSRSEALSKPDAPSLTGVNRNNWTPMVVLSPMDGIAATRTYSVNHIWTDSTPRQLGRAPTAVSAIDISGDTGLTQFWEVAASAPLAAIGALMIIPRMITHSPTREVRYFPEDYWRASPHIARKATPAPKPAEAPEIATPPEAPAK
jgi:hypothetical protein